MQRIAHIIDIVHNTAEDIALGMAVKIAKRQARKLFIHLLTHCAHHLLRYAGHCISLHIAENSAHSKQTREQQQNPADFTKIHCAACKLYFHLRLNRVYRVAQQHRAKHSDKGAKHRRNQHEQNCGPKRLQQAEQAQRRPAHIARPLVRRAAVFAAVIILRAQISPGILPLSGGVMFAHSNDSFLSIGAKLV